MPKRPLIIPRTKNETDGPICKQDHQSYMSDMSNPKLFSRAEVSALSSVPDDALVFWIRNGLLKSEERGQRQHHRFTIDEVKIAAILGEARSCGLNVSSLSAISNKLRKSIAYHAGLPKFPGWIDAIFWIDKDNLEQSYKELFEKEKYSRDQIQSIIDLGSDIDYESLGIGLTLIEGDGVILATKASNGEWLVEATEDLHRMEGRSAIAFDVKRIFANLNQQECQE